MCHVIVATGASARALLTKKNARGRHIGGGYVYEWARRPVRMLCHVSHLVKRARAPPEQQRYNM